MNDLPVLALAYLGDAVLELKVRSFLLEQNIVKVKELQETSIHYVSAKAQANFAKQFLEEGFYTPEEEAIYLRARNHKSHKSPKNTDIITYKCATGFEAVIGYLYQQKKFQRLETLFEKCLKKK